ncbi:type II toxin-antitoxin system YoeB family toxin [Prevotella histicola]
MGKYSVELVGTSKEDLQKIHKSGNKAVIKKIEALFLELSEHPQTGTGKPERLKNLPDMWSRRLGQEKQATLHDKRGYCCCLCCLPARAL